MRPPRRVPWASKAELSELYDLIFAPGASDLTRAAAQSRMSTYISSPSCPAFMHLLHTLVGALLVPYPPRSAQEAQVARMTYAMAVVRFVNGMVDPLQTGPYARPISHLAATLNLPSSLVSLRHRATHEDLPPLSLLRRAIEQATDYLHTQSLVPLLASSSSAGWERRARAEALVAKWKKIAKTRVRTRDVTNESESGIAVRRLKREVEEEADEVIEAVVRTGLVPVGRKKRSSRKATSPTSESLMVWTPLLEHLATTHPSTPATLAQHLASVLVDTAPRFQAGDDEGGGELASYRWTLGTWLLWLWGDEAGVLSVPEDERAPVLRRLARELLHDDQVLRRVYGLLAEESLEEMDALLVREEESDEEELQGLDIDDAAGDKEEEKEAAPLDVDAALAAMEGNLRALEQQLASRPTVAAPDETVPGWSRADNWAPCPIGVWSS